VSRFTSLRTAVTQGRRIWRMSHRAACGWSHVHVDSGPVQSCGPVPFAVTAPEWPNSHKLKIQDGGGHHLEFRKNVNNFGLDKDILHQIIWEDARRRRGDDHVTKSRNRKLIRVTSSNEGLRHMCVNLSDYRVYLNQILYRAQAPHY